MPGPHRASRGPLIEGRRSPSAHLGPYRYLYPSLGQAKESLEERAAE